MRKRSFRKLSSALQKKSQSRAASQACQVAPTPAPAAPVNQTAAAANALNQALE